MYGVIVFKEEWYMATSSITKNFVIRGRNEVEAFMNLFEAEPAPIPKLDARELTNPEEIRSLLTAWRDNSR